MKRYSAWYCRFALRVRKALLPKEIGFDCVEVDPCDYTDWRLKISRASAPVGVAMQSHSDGRRETSKVITDCPMGVRPGSATGGGLR